MNSHGHTLYSTVSHGNAHRHAQFPLESPPAPTVIRRRSGYPIEIPSEHPRSSAVPQGTPTVFRDVFHSLPQFPAGISAGTHGSHGNPHKHTRFPVVSRLNPHGHPQEEWGHTSTNGNHLQFPQVFLVLTRESPRAPAEIPTASTVSAGIPTRAYGHPRKIPTDTHGIPR